MIKCIKRSQRICVCKLKKILRGQPVTFQYRMVELFTREASKQWTELFQFNIHVKPLWFTGSRVYQLPTQIVPQSHWRYSGILENPHTTTRYDCKVRIVGKLKLILTFDLQTEENIGSNWSSPVENVMSQALRWQTVPIDSNDAFTGKHHVLFTA